MLVTQIREISKAKIRITLDYEFAFVLYKGELRSYPQLREGNEVDALVYESIKEEILYKRAKLYCMHLLEKRDYTEHQLKCKLNDAGYPKDVQEVAISYVKSFHYIDDVRYANSYVAYASGHKSRKQIQQELARKGVSQEIILQVLASEESQEDSELELINRLIVKKHYNDETATYEERRKMIGFLYRKGFALDKIYKVLREEDNSFENLMDGLNHNT